MSKTYKEMNCLQRRQFVFNHANDLFEKAPVSNTEFENFLYDYFDTMATSPKQDIDVLFGGWRLLFKFGRGISQCQCIPLTLKDAWESIRKCVKPEFPQFTITDVNNNMGYEMSFENAFAFLTQCAVIMRVFKSSTKRSVRNISIHPDLKQMHFRDWNCKFRPLITYFEWLVLLRSWVTWHHAHSLLIKNDDLDSLIETQLKTQCEMSCSVEQEADVVENKKVKQETKVVQTQKGETKQTSSNTQPTVEQEPIQSANSLNKILQQNTKLCNYVAFDASDSHLTNIQQHIQQELLYLSISNWVRSILCKADERCAISRCGRIIPAHITSYPSQLNALLIDLQEHRNDTDRQIPPTECFYCKIYFDNGNIIGYSVENPKNIVVANSI